MITEVKLKIPFLRAGAGEAHHPGGRLDKMMDNFDALKTAYLKERGYVNDTR